MTTSAETLEEREAVGRSVVYALLSRSFAFPSQEHLDELHEKIVPALREAASGETVLGALLADVVRELGAPLDELRDAHSSTFTHIEPVDFPPYESAYCSTDIFRQSDRMADVAAFYRAHGLRVGATERERPDHVATELEFMAFMAFKEAHALTHLERAHVEECRRTQDHFLRDHLGGWAPGFGRRLAAMAAHPLYRALGALVAAWVAAELDALGIEASAPVDEPASQPEPDDGACGFDGMRSCAPERGPVRIDLSRKQP